MQLRAKAGSGGRISANLIVIFILILNSFNWGYNLNWGNLLPFHPDENNIVWAVESIKWPNNLNPHFFAYGGLTIYLGALINHLTHIPVRLVLRLFSFWASFLGLWFIWLWAKNLGLGRKQKLEFLLLTGLVTGIAQQSHFGTVDNLASVLTLGGLVFLYQAYHHPLLKSYLTGVVLISLAVSIKISFGIYLLLIGPVLVKQLKSSRHIKPVWWLTGLIIPLTTFMIVNPYAWLDSSAFVNSLNYETQVALGKLSVFYTRQFLEVKKVWFVLKRILFFNLNPLIMILAGAGLYLAIKQKRLFLSLIIFITLIQPVGWFVLWTRFFTLWFYLALVLAMLVWKQLRTHLRAGVVILSAIWLAGFLQSTYWQIDSRLEFSQRLISTISAPAVILQEEGNVINLPISQARRLPRSAIITTFNPYVLDEADNYDRLMNRLKTVDYIIIGSRRAWFNHLRLKTLFPKTAGFYQQLFDGNLGFKPVFKVKRSFKFLFWEINDEALAEETFTVFDHPQPILFSSYQPGP